ncbi:MAG: zinc ribbon domain-containing protein [Pseudomonadota bacterium]
MKARLENGNYVFHLPIGYRFGRDKVHGKLLVRDEPVASIVQEGLSGFANGRFRSVAELQRFFEADPHFPKTNDRRFVRPTKVKEILERVTYAGYVEAPNCGVTRRKGHHEPLISLSDHECIEKVLSGVVYGARRKDIRSDFPLRGFVLCDDCGKPYTSCWSKGRLKAYPYYVCDTWACPSKRKLIARDKIEGGAVSFLKSVQQTEGLLNAARAMLSDLWDAKLEHAQPGHAKLATEVTDIEKQIDQLLDKIVDATSDYTVRAYEARIAKLEREKMRLDDQRMGFVPLNGRLGEVIEHALMFLANPWNLYKKGDLHLRGVVLKLVS